MCAVASTEMTVQNLEEKAELNETIERLKAQFAAVSANLEIQMADNSQLSRCRRAAFCFLCSSLSVTRSGRVWTTRLLHCLELLLRCLFTNENTHSVYELCLVNSSTTFSREIYVSLEDTLTLKTTSTQKTTKTQSLHMHTIIYSLAVLTAQSGRPRPTPTLPP